MSFEISPSNLPVYFVVDRVSSAFVTNAVSDDFEDAKRFADNEDGIVTNADFLRKKGHEILMWEQKQKPRSKICRVTVDNQKFKIGFK
jgi:hypothetical protein